MLEILELCAERPGIGAGICLVFMFTLSSVMLFILILTGKVKPPQ